MIKIILKSILSVLLIICVTLTLAAFKHLAFPDTYAMLVGMYIFTMAFFGIWSL